MFESYKKEYESEISFSEFNEQQADEVIDEYFLEYQLYKQEMIKKYGKRWKPIEHYYCSICDIIACGFKIMSLKTSFLTSITLNNENTLVVCPFEHKQNYFQLTNQEKDDIDKLLSQAKYIIEEKYNNIVDWEIDFSSSEKIPHLHIKIKPILGK